MTHLLKFIQLLWELYNNQVLTLVQIDISTELSLLLYHTKHYLRHRLYTLALNLNYILIPVCLKISRPLTPLLGTTRMLGIANLLRTFISVFFSLREKDGIPIGIKVLSGIILWGSLFTIGFVIYLILLHFQILTE